MLHAYFILENGEQNGPFTFEEIIQKGLDIHTRVMSPVAEKWEEACDLPEFYPYFESKNIYFPTEANLATFGWRMLAYLIDLIILSMAMIIILNVLAANGITFNIENYNSLIRLQLGFFGILILYNSVCEASPLMGSLGKKACKLLVVDADGRKLTYMNALVRSFGKALSVFLMYIGFFSILFNEHRQSLHDYLAKSYIIKKGL